MRISFLRLTWIPAGALALGCVLLSGGVASAQLRTLRPFQGTLRPPPQMIFNNLYQTLYGNQGLGTILGMELLIKWKPDSRFFGWLAYTLSRSTRRNAPGLPEYLAQYDQTHNLTMLGSYRLGRGWELGARYRIISGPLVTPVTSALYAADAAAYTELTGPPFSRRLPLFHQLDVRIDKGWQFHDWRLSAYLELINVYSNAAKEALDYNYNFTQTQYQNGLPFIPNLGIRGDI